MRTSLLRRGNRLLLGVGLLSTLLSAGFAWLAWNYTLAAYTRRQAEETARHYRLKVEEHRRNWKRAAERLRAQIEFLRLGELPAERRRASLLAYFNAQGENREFAGVLLADAGGLPLLSLGCQVMLQEGLDRVQVEPETSTGVFLLDHCSEGPTSPSHSVVWLRA